MALLSGRQKTSNWLFTILKKRGVFLEQCACTHAQVIKDKKTDPGHCTHLFRWRHHSSWEALDRTKREMSKDSMLSSCHLLFSFTISAQENWQFKISGILIWISTTWYFVMASISYKKGQTACDGGPKTSMPIGMIHSREWIKSSFRKQHLYRETCLPHKSIICLKMVGKGKKCCCVVKTGKYRVWN